METEGRVSSSAQAAIETTTRERILRSALSCFSNNGYHKTTMDDIVTESGLSKGALYWHFQSKRQLFISLLSWLMYDLGEEASRPYPDDTAASEKIRATVIMSASRIEQLLPFSKVIIDFWAQTLEDDQVMNMFETLMQRFQRLLVAIIEEGISRGEFRKVDSDKIALSLIGILDSLWLYKTMRGDEIDFMGSIESAVDVMLAGLNLGRS